MSDTLVHALGERLKELTALHTAARILQDDSRAPRELMEEIAALLPGAWQHPEVAAARVRFEQLEVLTPGFRETPWLQTARFTTRSGAQGSVTPHPDLRDQPSGAVRGRLPPSCPPVPGPTTPAPAPDPARSPQRSCLPRHSTGDSRPGVRT